MRPWGLLSLILLSLGLGLTHAGAATYWVDGTNGLDTNACHNIATPSPTPKRTPAGGTGCLASGDTLVFRAGTYTLTQAYGCYGGGSGGQCPPSNTTIKRHGTEVVTFRPASSALFYVINLNSAQGSRSGITFDGIDCDALNLSGTCYSVGFGESVANAASNITIKNANIRNTKVDGIGIGCANNNVTLENNVIHDLGSSQQAQGLYGHAIYGVGDNMIIRRNRIANIGNFGIQIFDSSGPCRNEIENTTIEGNLIDRVGLSSGAANGIIVNFAKAGTTIKILNNVISRTTSSDCIGVGFSTGVTYQVYNNTLSQCGPGAAGIARQGSGTNTALLTNNIAHGSSAGLTQAQGSWTSFTDLTNFVGDPGFASIAGGDYHIRVSGSPVINAGTTLAEVPVDAEGIVRPAGQNTIGAYQFASTPPGPFGNVARWKCDEGIGTSCADTEVGSGPGGHTLTLNTAGWTTGIIGPFALNLDGTRWGSATGSADLKPATQAGISAWIRTTSVPASGVGFIATLPSDAFGPFVRATGAVGCQAVIAGQFHSAEGGSVLTGTNRHVSCSYKSGDGLRVRLDNAQVGFLALSGSLDYTLGGGQARVGRSDLTSGLEFIGVLNQVYLFDQEITAAGNTALFNEYVPSPGFSVTHMAWYAAHAAQGNQLGATDTDRSHPLTTPLGIRWAIHKGDAGSLTEYFRPYARVLSNTGAVLVDWTEITNSFGSLGVRYLQDTAINQGDATSPLLPLDGFTGIAGKVLENPIDTTAPYADIQRLTIGQGQHAELEIRVEFGSPLVPGQQVEIRPQRENGSPFESYADKIYAIQFPGGVDVLLPQPFSPVIDAVSCLGEVTTDIRGMARPQGADCDIGAYEMPSPGLVAGRQGGTYAGGTLR